MSVVLEGDIAADASDGVDPETLPRSPSGTECLETIERPAGPMALCWDAYRDPHDADPLQDFYRLRVHGTFGRERGAGVRWAAIRVRLIGQPSNQTIESWPDGEFDGRCEEVKVSLGPGPDSGAVPVETLCARTAGSTTAGRDEWSQRVTWTCVGCLIADHKDRAIALHEWLAVPAGTVPSWEIFADLGS